MTAAIARERLAVQLAIDHEQRRTAPVVSAAVYTSSSGVAGSTLHEFMTGGVQSAGVAINEQTAMQVSAVYASVGLIGGAIASIPLEMYKRTPEGREPYDSDLWWLFNESPWPSWTAASAWEFAVQTVLLRGDAHMRIHRASRLSPKIVGFEPLHRSWVDARKNGDRIAYAITRPDVATEIVDQDDVLHFPGLGFNGLNSITPLVAALKNSVGIGLAADRFAAQFFDGKARSDLVLSTSGKVSPQQQDDIRTGWDKRNAGTQNSRYPIVLSGDWKVEQIGISAEEMQLLSTRQYQVEDIARIYGVPPHMIGKTDASTSWGSGIENMGRAFVIYTLNRHLTRMQQEINRKCWPRSLKVFARFAVDELMEGDNKTQSEYFAKALGGPGTQGWMTVNEARKRKHLKPLGPEWDTVAVAGSKAADSAAAAAETAADAVTDNHAEDNHAPAH